MEDDSRKALDRYSTMYYVFREVFKIRTHLEKKFLRFVLISLRYFVTKFENSVKAMFIVTYHLLLKLKMWSLQEKDKDR